MKYFFVILFIFYSPLLYSQYLEEHDIDIAVNGWDDLLDYMKEFRADEEFNNYYVQSDDIYKYFFAEIYDDEEITDDKFANILEQYQRFMEIEAPEGFNKAFKKIGWPANGHQKYWTIFFAGNYLSMIASTGFSGTPQLIALFNENDLNILNEILEKLFEKWRKQILDLLQEMP